MVSLMKLDIAAVPLTALYLTATDEDPFGSIESEEEIPRPDEGSYEFSYLDGTVYALGIDGAVYKVEGLSDQKGFVRRGVEARQAAAREEIEAARSSFEETERRCTSNIEFWGRYLEPAA